MCEPSQAKHTSPFLEKFDALTYGLIYPAFLGAMIYDLADGAFGTGPLKGTALYIDIVIVLFNSLDYMHLYVDMPKLVYKHFGGEKGPVYIFCDFFGSCLFYGAFLLTKYHHPFWAMFLLGLLPTVTAIYKEHYLASTADRRFTRRYAIGFILLTIVGACIFSCDCMISSFLLPFAIVELLIYALYVFRWFPSYFKITTARE